VVHYGGEDEGERRRVQHFLTGHGWVLRGAAELTSGDGGAVLQFQAPGCSGLVAVALLPSNGEMTDLFARAAGSSTRIFYLHRGRTYTNPPRFAYFHEKIADLLGLLTFQPRPNSSFVAVAELPECRFEAVVPWSQL
jgi:hypothetical protein